MLKCSKPWCRVFIAWELSIFLACITQWMQFGFHLQKYIKQDTKIKAKYKMYAYPNANAIDRMVLDDMSIVFCVNILDLCMDSSAMQGFYQWQ